jgi:hypothetical protein
MVVDNEEPVTTFSAVSVSHLCRNRITRLNVFLNDRHVFRLGWRRFSIFFVSHAECIRSPRHIQTRSAEGSCLAQNAICERRVQVSGRKLSGHASVGLPIAVAAMVSVHIAQPH